MTERDAITDLATLETEIGVEQAVRIAGCWIHRAETSEADNAALASNLRGLVITLEAQPPAPNHVKRAYDEANRTLCLLPHPGAALLARLAECEKALEEIARLYEEKGEFAATFEQARNAYDMRCIARQALNGGKERGEK